VKTCRVDLTAQLGDEGVRVFGSAAVLPAEGGHRLSEDDGA